MSRLLTEETALSLSSNISSLGMDDLTFHLARRYFKAKLKLYFVLSADKQM